MSAFSSLKLYVDQCGYIPSMQTVHDIARRHTETWHETETLEREMWDYLKTEYPEAFPKAA